MNCSLPDFHSCPGPEIKIREIDSHLHHFFSPSVWLDDGKKQISGCADLRMSLQGYG